MNFLRLCLAVAVLVGFAGTSRGAVPVPQVVTAQVLAADSLSNHTVALLARGQVTEAIEYWALTTGKDAPAWLLAIRTAFDASKQVAGACQGVAQTIHVAFTRLGGRPEFVELRTVSARDFPYMLFKMPNGRESMMTETGYHVVVRMNGRAYDAYTGATGLPWAEYMSRLGARSDITQTVVESVTGAR
ncbi:hypothetical protein MEBOL_003373 [Melittangium boletus DSM 14713]|uniref:Lipoprotein n=1 Tax=Melittangium boletus DSM 14713 TaxID=1294270 RepID=A0A250IFA1_9BACT|nr:hypothetical protein MEBOL_003373 [Melittangium boletus DSM 14713]